MGRKVKKIVCGGSGTKEDNKNTKTWDIKRVLVWNWDHLILDAKELGMGYIKGSYGPPGACAWT